MHNRLLPFTLLVLFLASTAMADKATQDGVSLDREVTVDGEALELYGYGTARYARVFKVYVAGFYGPKDVTPEDVLEKDVPRRLEIEYLRSIDADDINEATREMLERQLDEDTYAEVKDRFAYLADLYEDVGEGDRYAFEYIPGEGGTLYFNGEAVGNVEGEDFARAYFGIWLGEDPLSSSLKRQLLGQR
ncbi:chalcone isomerase family protein [Methylonatrum kenyense]|uniref:chalcone isomerase family protein n=1 Tax=Methylonatrum kenyense TaxID=455253 RepID=UPI0020BDA6D5|nr:chalcone isomerase family protein [Methylonatrum kenyense]MCK8515479.1 chalcone isomerase family protein [Methylonatrum kenyense]